MAKKKSVQKIKEAAHTKILKKHFPTFYEKPGYAVIILAVLLLLIWMLRLG